MKNKEKRLIKLVSAKILLGLVSFLLALYVFGAIAHEIFHHQEAQLDQTVFDFLSAYTNDTVVWWMRLLTLFGKPEFLIPAYILLITWFVVRKQKGLALEIGIIAATSTLFSFVLKFIFRRDRPSDQLFGNLGGYSFPSGHALLGFVFCSVLMYLIWRSKIRDAFKVPLGILLFFFSLSIGISRIVLRVHYASDVIAGFAMGYAWVLLFLWVQHRRALRLSRTP